MFCMPAVYIMAFQEGVPKTTPFRAGSLLRSQEFSLLMKAWLGAWPSALTSNRFCCVFLGGGEGVKSLTYPLNKQMEV